MSSLATVRHLRVAAPARLAVGAWLALACNSSATKAAGVYISAGIAVTNGPIVSIYKFGLDGTPQGYFGRTIGRPNILSIAAHGTTLFVAQENAYLKKYSANGDFLGDASGADLGQTQFGAKIETDLAGSIYYHAGNVIRRINANGFVTQAYPTTPQFVDGIDADRHGNLYALRRDFGIEARLYKYNSAGTLVGFVAISQFGILGDLVIDEAGEMLYFTDLNDDAFSIKAYDISGSAPVFHSAIPTPGALSGLFFDPASRHLFATQASGIRGWELALDGAIIRRFRIDADEGSAFHFDIAAITIPEPSTMLLALTIVGLVAWRRRLTAR